MRERIHHKRIGLAFEHLARRPEMHHVFTSKNRDGGGNVSLSGGRDRDAALRERQFWSDWLDVDPTAWVVGGQVHGNNIAVVDESHRGRGAVDPSEVIPDTDGILTCIPGLPLYVAVADCAPVLFFAQGAKPWVGTVHAGWRGLKEHVLLHAVERICEHAQVDPQEVHAGVGPCIGLLHFEVGEEVVAYAPAKRRVQLGAEGQWHVDLAGWANDQLLEAGLPQKQIEISGLDTHERTDLFFSHRRDGQDTGRMGLLAVLA